MLKYLIKISTSLTYFYLDENYCNRYFAEGCVLDIILVCVSEKNNFIEENIILSIHK